MDWPASLSMADANVVLQPPYPQGHLQAAPMRDNTVCTNPPEDGQTVCPLLQLLLILLLHLLLQVPQPLLCCCRLRGLLCTLPLPLPDHLHMQPGTSALLLCCWTCSRLCSCSATACSYSRPCWACEDPNMGPLNPHREEIAWWHIVLLGTEQPLLTHASIPPPPTPHCRTSSICLSSRPLKDACS